MGVQSLEQLRERAQSFTEEIAREGYLASSGLKTDAELQSIYNRYTDILDRETLTSCIERHRDAPEASEDRRSARLLLEWQVEAQAARQLAELDEREIALENSATILLPEGGRIGYEEVAIEIMNTDDRVRRNAIDDARAAVVREQFAPLRLERLQREQHYVTSLGIAPSYNATFETLTGISLSDLSNECAAFLRDTQAMWDEARGDLLRAANIPLDQATRADVLAIFRLREYDDAFPASLMVDSIRRNCNEMGLDAFAEGRIVFDLEDRPGKRSRAFCSPVRIPEEVYLVMRPHGGQTDYNTLLHELGHALHFGYARPDYPFEYRWIGDNSVTESYAMLFDHRMMDRGWLLRYTEMSTRRVESFLRIAAVDELQMLRRYCAKFIYEYQVYGGAIPWSALPELYVETLGKATGFRYHTADAFIDFDPRYYATRYLRAWQLQAVINESLTERFNDDWWRNPSAGPWMIEHLFAEGQRETGTEIAARVANSELNFAPFVRGLEAVLG